MCFWIIYVLAIVHAIDLFKYASIEFLDDGDLSDYTNLGFLLIYCITRIYTLILNAYRNGKLKAMTSAMNDATFGVAANKYIVVTAYAVGLLSLLLAILDSLFGDTPFHQWTLKDAVLAKAYHVSHALFVWSATNYENVTVALEQKYASDLSWLSVCMGIAKGVMHFCGSLEEFVLGDLILMAAASLMSNLDGFQRGLKSKPASTVTYSEFKKTWNEYQIIAKASEEFYDACNTLLTLYHIYNLLELAVLLKLILKKRTGYMRFIATGVNVVKCMLTYYWAIKISDKVCVFTCFQ